MHYLKRPKHQVKKEFILGSTLSTYELTTRVIENFRHLISTDDFKEFFVMDVRKMYENAIMACYNAYESEPMILSSHLRIILWKRAKTRCCSMPSVKTRPGNLAIFRIHLLKRNIALKANWLKCRMTFINLNFENADPEIIRNCQFESARIQNEYDRISENT